MIDTTKITFGTMIQHKGNFYAVNDFTDEGLLDCFSIEGNFEIHEIPINEVDVVFNLRTAFLD